MKKSGRTSVQINMRLKLCTKNKRPIFFHIDTTNETFEEIVSRMNQELKTNNMTPVAKDKTIYESVKDFRDGDVIFMEYTDDQLFMLENGEYIKNYETAHLYHSEGRKIYFCNGEKITSDPSNPYYIIANMSTREVITFLNSKREASDYACKNRVKGITYMLLYHRPHEVTTVY